MSRRRRKDDAQMKKFSSTLPHFFKIILEETLRTNKLQIPNKFVRMYGDTLSDSIRLELPRGLKWDVGLTKCDGKVWIGEGRWADFSNHYSLGHGYLLVFRYEGNSRFHVLIFDKSTTEIDYLPKPNRVEKHDIDGQPREFVKEETEEDDDSVEISERFSPCPKPREKSPLPCPRPHKRTRTNPVEKTQSNHSHPRPKVHKDATSKVRQVTQRGSISSKAVTGDTVNKKTEMPALGKCLEPLTVNKKARALEVASSFRSENPFFTVSLGSTYVTAKSRLNIPYKFAKTYINKIEGNAILKVSNGRSWSVQYKVRSRLNHSPAYEFCQGWTAFARDNNLEEGDICTFELTNGNDLSFDVSIVKANVPLPQRNFRKLRSEDNGAGGGHVIQSPSISSVSGASKAASQFFSTNPYFQVTLQRRNLEKRCVSPPTAFSRSYFKGKARTVILQVGRRSWPVKLLRYPSKYVSSGGWNSFARENSLRQGDVCIFELINRNQVVMKVSIFGQNGCISS